jgi:uncharacterized membrane protein YtjA (UPF0391 family)
MMPPSLLGRWIFQRSLNVVGCPWNRRLCFSVACTTPANARKEREMLYWALMFLVIALLAGIFGFGGIASTATGIAQILFVIALVLFVVSLFTGFVRRRT